MFGETPDLGAKNFNKMCLKIVQKVLKWPLQYANFQKFSGGVCPRTPLEPFLFSIYFKIILPETRLKIWQIWVLPPRKNILNTLQT